MTVWMNRQEAIHRFQLYLDWAHPSSAAAGTQDVDPRDKEEDEMDVDETSGKYECPPYVVARTPISKSWNILAPLSIS